MTKKIESTAIHDKNERERRIVKLLSKPAIDNIDESLESIYEAERKLNESVECLRAGSGNGNICFSDEEFSLNEYVDNYRYYFYQTIKCIKAQIEEIENYLEIDFDYSTLND